MGLIDKLKRIIMGTKEKSEEKSQVQEVLEQEKVLEGTDKDNVLDGETVITEEPEVETPEVEEPKKFTRRPSSGPGRARRV